MSMPSRMAAHGGLDLLDGPAQAICGGKFGHIRLEQPLPSPHSHHRSICPADAAFALYGENPEVNS